MMEFAARALGVDNEGIWRYYQKEGRRKTQR
jgi:hypothetical protein